MFGGLEVKGSDKKKEETPPEVAPATAAAPSASAFSFLSSSPAPAAEAPVPASSGFSFLNPEPAPVEAPASPVAAAPSAFSFLSSPSKDESDAGGSAAATPADNISSGFGFLSTPEDAVATPEATSMPAPAADTGLSSFGFLSTNDTVSTMSRDSPALSDSGLMMSTPPSTTTNSSMDLLATGNPNQPAGSGVVFGNAAAVAKKPKKKRTRSAKVGVAAQQQQGSAASAAMANMTPPRPPAATTTTTPSYEAAAVPTRDAAQEASKRAEEFMQAKLQESSVPTAPPVSVPVSSYTPGVSHDSSADDDDDIVAAAKAAAEEAQNMNGSRRSLSDRMGLGGIAGGLFRRNNASPPNSASQHGAVNAAGHNNRPPVPVTASMDSTSASAVLTPAERLQKEQEEVKRAMAERQLKMMQQPAVSHDSQDRPSDSSYTPVSVPEYRPNIVSVMSVPSPRRPGESAAAPVQQIAVPKPKTATDLFHDMMSEFRSQVVVCMQRVSQLRQQRSMLLEERFVSVAKERLAVQQKAAAEAQQMTAAESEDFELADRMGNVIDGHERERAELATILENIGRALAQLEQQKNEVVQGVTECFAKIQAKLGAFQKEQESKDTVDAADSLRKFSIISKQLSAENARLQQDLKHIEKDENLVAEERKELEEAISEQSGTFEKLRDDAKEKLKEVDEEIEELRMKLSAKQAVAAELRTESAGHDEAVLRVRVKFARQLTRVQKKETTIRDNKEDWELEKSAYDQSHESHEVQVTEHSEALLARDQLLDALSKEVDMADTFESIVAKEIGFEAGAEGESDDDLTQLQAAVVKCDAAAGEAKEFFKVASGALASLEEEVKSLEVRIPQLEDTKKAAAASRDFKAAGKASKEIKEATARLKECEDNLVSEAHERKVVAEAEVTKLEADLEEKRKLANEKEKVSGLVAMERLGDNIKRLLATKKSVCGDASENTIQGVGALVLDGQIKALKMEGQTYGDKFGGWTELMAEIGADDVEDAPVTTNEAQDTAADEPVASKEEEAPVVEPTPSEPESQESKAERIASFQKLTIRLKELEDALEDAAVSEEYEEAAELDEQLQQLLLDLGALNLTEQELDEAMQEPLESAPSVEAAPSVETAPSVEISPSVETAEEEEQVEEVAPVEVVQDEVEAYESTPATDEDDDNGDDDDDIPIETPSDTDVSVESVSAALSQDDIPAYESAESNDVGSVDGSLVENGSEDKDDLVNGDGVDQAESTDEAEVNADAEL